MKTSEDLKQILERIDHRGYPAYKDTRGAYQFGTYILGIDHVQGDPFAAPSQVTVYRCAGRAVRDSRNIYMTARLQKDGRGRIICCASLRARSRKFPLKRKDLERAALWRSAVRDRKC